MNVNNPSQILEKNRKSSLHVKWGLEKVPHENSPETKNRMTPSRYVNVL
jgi:hypothetical protein